MNEQSGRRPQQAAPIVGECLDIGSLGARYWRRTVTPGDVIEGILAQIEARGDDKVWIELVPADELRAMARDLEARGPSGKALYGIPFAIKDNIDLAGRSTTAACPAFTYRAERSALAVQRLVDAGAIPVGKTNLDQFATGLSGTRSPYGAPASVFNPDFISGGSSSGSAVAVAAGLVSFALGTDTAGSGRVPAAFNNVIGLKPTRGRISTRGLVPACRSLDCVSIFALTADDAGDVLAVIEGFDAADPFSRRANAAAAARSSGSVSGCRFGVPRPDQLAFFGNTEGHRLFLEMLQRVERLGGRLVEIDFAPFLETARLLYYGPWVAERYLAVGEMLERQPEAVYPMTREIIAGGSKPLGTDVFAGYYRLCELRRVIEPVWEKIDAVITPTAGRQYRIADVLADPRRLNDELGYFTNFMNLLDLAAVAVPAGFQADGLAFGVTLASRAWSDQALLSLADSLHRAQNLTLGGLHQPLPPQRTGAQPIAPSAVAAQVRVAVCGAHMSGLPLNYQLTERGGRLLRQTRTAAGYRLFALPGGPPERPGMLRADRGAVIEVEVWELPTAAFGSFVAAIPPPLGIGTLELEDGERVKGFLCEAHATIGARDITEFGGWRRYLEYAKQRG